MHRSAIFAASVDYFLHPIAKYMQDPTVTEVMINRFDQVYIERAGRLSGTDVKFESEDALVSAINNIAQSVGREINFENPILDARLPDGSRVHAILPPGCRNGACLTIRKFSKGGLSLDDLMRFGSLTASSREFIELCVRMHKNVVISGGTGTGKTSLLGAVSAAIPADERIVVIEDTSELKLRQPHCIYLEVQRPDPYGRGAISIRDLFIASLRMRPDRILVGEVRGGEALDLLQSMLSGHEGSLSTVHANTARDALVRLETLSLMSNVEIPIYVARTQVASAIDIVVQLERISSDGSRRITQIAEVMPLDQQQQYVMKDLYRAVRRGKTAEGKLDIRLEPTGEKPTFATEPFEQGIEEAVRESAALWTSPPQV